MVSVAVLAAVLTLQTPDLTCRVRDKAGHLIRSRSRRAAFIRSNGGPRQGYAVDHIVPLACGGCDVPSNMQWLTLEEWRAKTRWERQPCSAWWDGTYTRALAAGLKAGGR